MSINMDLKNKSEKPRNLHQMMKNVGWNLFGTGFPLIIAVYAIPQLIEGFGSTRFGLLTLIWAMIGYFSIFDLGLGRALTKLVSERLGTAQQQDLPDLVKTSIALIASLGVFATLFVFCGSTWLLREILHVTPDLMIESSYAVWVLAISLPFVVLSSALIGLLEAYKEFKQINLIRVTLGISNFLGPLIVLHWSNSIYYATTVLALARILSTILYGRCCYQVGALGKTKGKVKKSLFRQIFKFGAWITVSNIISPIMVQMDRFVISSVLSVSVLAYYSVPADMINRLSFFPAAIISVLFPAFSSLWVSKRESGIALFTRSCRIMTIAVAIPTVFIVIYANQGLEIWLGTNFSAKSTVIFQWLLIGFFVNSIARIPHTLLQSTGHPDATAKLHLLELPIYGIVLWWLLNKYGVIGAAIAWTFRISLDMVLLFITAGTLLPTIKRLCWNWIGSTLFFTVIISGLAFLNLGNHLKLIMAIGLVSFYGIFSYLAKTDVIGMKKFIRLK
ncbi:MAG: flippase [Oxalobacteraceae bacterium]|nr:flippase [Oxalobacteraceae bacterium]